ncbi:hypothetical protein K466DRAFT_666773 [Polyporus arcularius HHB13444]|uniref:Transcription activator of gluconeogenesis ERT1 n=1 Tax=Polyporus arcularius HHB13444 TaxID=1314778 RepID=A0A5C3P052_9APHY|nr:hypothetical protein K466DRAFT_666773 [Polyporus arcularius HHB13444]
MGDSNPESDSQHDPQSPTDSVQPQMTMHPITYSSMPTMHMYPFPPGMVSSQPTRTKRRQVKNACTNCQKACKKCDDARPCLRCVKYGIAEECIDSQRKERQKGIKRGPYKKRDGKTTNVDEQQVDVAVQPQGIPVPQAVAAAVPSATPPIPYAAPVTYPPGFYPQYPAPPAAKPGETPMYYPQIYFAPIPAPPPQATGQDGEPIGYPPPQYYPATFLAPYPPQYATQYMMPHPAHLHAHMRPDAQMPMAPAHHYAPYPQAYAKPMPRGAEVAAAPQMVDARRDGRMDHTRMGEPIHGAQAKA